MVLALSFVMPAGATAATITVTGTSDELTSNGSCSLREAVQAANTDAAVNDCAAGTGADTISIPAGTFKLTLTGAGEDANATGDLDVLNDARLRGAGAGQTILDGNGTDRVVDIVTGTVSVAKLTVTGGLTPAGADGAVGGGSGAAAAGGGGIRNAGSLTITNATISGNATGAGGAGGPATGVPGGPGAAGGVAVGGPGGAGGAGGGVLSSGTLTLAGTTISANTTGNGGTGATSTGGAGGNGTTTQTGGTGGVAIGGSGGAGGAGAGVAATATTSIAGSQITGNTTGRGGDAGSSVGGAGGNGGPTNGPGGASGVSISGGGGAGGSGAGLSATDTLAISDTTIAGNSSGRGGNSSTATSGASGNAGGGNAAGGSSAPSIGGNGGAGGAGAGVLVTGAVTLDGVTISGNSGGNGGLPGAATGALGGNGSGTGAGGSGGVSIGGAGGAGGDGAGLSAAGTTEVVNATFTGNTAGNGGAGMTGTGGSGGHGGAANGNGGNGGPGLGGNGGAGGNGGSVVTPAGTTSLLLTHVTVSSSAAGSAANGASGIGGAGGAGGGAGLPGAPGSGTGGPPGAAGVGGGLFRQAGTVTFKNSIASQSTPANCSGTVTNGGHNIGFPDITCGATAGDPKLGTLQDNGGPTQTQALGAGSAALDNVPVGGSGCPSTDQRGVRRPRGAGCDAGAFEVAPPDVSGGSASPVGERDATLLAGVNPNGRVTTYHFEYGTSEDYGSRTPDAVIGTGVSTSQVSAAITGLTPAKTYHLRIVVDGAGGAVTGDDATFTTLPLSPPVVTTGPAAAIHATSAGVTGTVNPSGHATTYHFDYGPTTAYGAKTADASAGSAVTAGAVSATLTPLARATTYHYRLVAVSEDGTVIGEDRTVTTAKDKKAPVLTKVSMSPKVFRVDGTGKPETAVKAAKKGTSFHFTLSEAARVVFTIRTATKKNKLVARFARTSKSGKNTKTFSGRIGKHKRLSVGRYRVTLVAADAAGNRSKPVMLAFRVVRR
jgi:CSLREA domain-containing protein